MLSKLSIRVFYLSFMFIGVTHAQIFKPDSALKTPIKNAESLFNSSIKQQSLLLNGPAFQNYASNVDGSANFLDLTSFIWGDVIYDGYRFNGVAMMYDLYEDKVIAVKNNSAMYSLVSQKVSDFYLSNHHFKYINVVDTTTTKIRSGFFDVLYNGDLKILAKRVKKVQLSINNQDKDLRYFFVPKTTYYLERNNQYEVIANESAFFNLFKDKKTELKKHLSNYKIKFKKKPEEAMILLAAYYENKLR